MVEISLKGRRALVCGASQGIGAAVAKAFASAGAEVVLLARDPVKLEAVRKSLPGQGHQVLAMDLAEISALKAAVEKYLPIQILVNNAGGPAAGSLLTVHNDDFIKAFESHVLAAQALTQICWPGMRQVSWGRIINVISTSVKTPIPNLGVSNTIRGAVANWSKTLSQELAQHNITVNNILPGYTQTPRLQNLRKATADKLQIPEAQVETQWKASIPVGRFAEPEEIANAALFLASPMASYINGINLPVDGGRTPSL